jgi:hypothetical protein
MRKVISFCVWGDSHIYNYGLYENALLLESIFPDWIMYVYYTKTANQVLIKELKRMKNVECEYVNVPNHYKNTMLRFLAGFDIQNDIVIFRDADSRLMKRDYYLVEDWLNNSDKDVHIIRDHPANRSLIMAGLWGVRNKFLATPQHILKFWEFYQSPDSEKWSLDQLYLNRYIYPLVKDTTRIHAQFNRHEKWSTDVPRYVISNGKKIDFPSRKIGFCGMTITHLPNASKKFNLARTSYVKKRVK